MTQALEKMVRGDVTLKSIGVVFDLCARRRHTLYAHTAFRLSEFKSRKDVYQNVDAVKSKTDGYDSVKI